MLWVGVRVFFVVSAVLSGPDLARAMQGRPSGAALGLILLFFSLVGVAFVLGLGGLVRIANRAQGLWHRPSWKARPLFGEPLQLFHAASWAFIGAGMSAATTTVATGQGSLIGAAVVLGFGGGLLGGTHLFVRLFPRSFAR
jgi:hypothetical protein